MAPTEQNLSNGKQQSLDQKMFLLQQKLQCLKELSKIHKVSICDAIMYHMHVVIIMLA